MVKGNLLTVTDTFSGSVFTVSDISGYPILDVTSDYYTSSINTIGFLNHTGSAGVTGSLIVSGGFIIHDNANNLIDSTQEILYDLSGVRSVLWNDRILKDSTNTTSINWEQRYFVANDGSTIHIDWSNPSYMNFPSINTSTIVNVLGLDGAGNLYATASTAFGGGGSGTPGGSNKQIQFNANGTSFSGSSNFTFDSSSNTVVLTGSLTVSGSGTFTNIGPAIFTGSVNITGSTTLTGSLNVSGSITGSLFGTASWAQSASKVLTNNDAAPVIMYLTYVRQTGSLVSQLGVNSGLSYNVTTNTVSTTSSQALTASFWSGYSSTSSLIGNGLSSSFNINHGFNTLNLHITVYSASGTYETVYPDVRRVNTNTASIIFANPPTTDQYIVYISQ